MAVTAVAAGLGDDDVDDMNQFRRYGSRFVFDWPEPVLVGVRPDISGDAVGALPST